MRSSISFTAAGDFLVQRHMPESYEGFPEVRDFILRGDFRFFNLETVFTDETCYGNQFYGGAYLRADPEVLVPLGHDLSGQRFRWGALLLELPLLGEHQRKNLSLVLTVLELLRDRDWNIPDAAIQAGIRSVRWPGRFEVLGRDPLFVLDGGHNPQCMDALWEAANSYLSGRALTVITGVLADKDYASMYDRTGRLASRFFTLTPSNPRALSGQELAKLLERYGKPVRFCESPAEAVRLALEATPKDGAVLAYGSLYLASEIRAEYLAEVTSDK